MLSQRYLHPGMLQRSVAFISRWQTAVVFGGRRFALARPVEDVMPDGGKGKDLHAWARNVDTTRYVIEAFSEEGDLVADPLFGSATTAQAALESGRRFVGSDSDPDCLQIARKRFNGVLASRVDDMAAEAG
jgi:hypothetical protein